MRRSVVRIFGAAILIIAVSMSLHLAYSYVYVMHGLTEGFEIDGVYELRSGRHPTITFCAIRQLRQNTR